MAKPSIDIIIRTKGRSVFLKRALKSVESQTYQNYTVIIINDAGPIDEVDHIINTQEPFFKNKIKVIHNKVNEGRWPSANKAIRHGRSDFIVLLDDDDSWQPTYLDESLKKIQNKNSEGVVTASIKIIEECNDDKIATIATEPYFTYIGKPLLQELIEKNIIPTNGFMYSRKAYTAVGGYDDSMPVLADWDYNIRFLELYDIEVVPNRLAQIHHRNSVNNIEHANTVVQGVDQHHETRAALLNSKLRTDIRNKTLGIGYMMNNEDGKRRRQEQTIDRISSHNSEVLIELRELKSAVDNLQHQINTMNENIHKSVVYRAIRKVKRINKRGVK